MSDAINLTGSTLRFLFEKSARDFEKPLKTPLRCLLSRSTERLKNIKLGRSQGISTTTVIVIVIAIVVIGGLAYYFYTVQRSSAKTTVATSIPSGVASNTALSFTPSTIKVKVGVNNTIVWTNQDSTQHTVTSGSVPSGAASFDSGNISPNNTFTVTLTVTGTYQYHCSIHPGWMKGTVVVVP